MLRRLFVVSFLCLAGTVASADDGAPQSRTEVETIVREYLLANPEILEEAFTVLQERRQAAEDEARLATIAEHRETLVASPNDGVLGNPDGDVTMVEFFDYNCGYCRRAMGDLAELLESDPNLRVVLKEFPVLGQASMEAAAVSISVQALHPEAYGDFHHRLMASEGRADAASALKIAEEMNLSRDAIEESMRSDHVRSVVEESYELAQSLGLSGTPSYVIGDAVEFGAVGFDQLQGRINEARCGSLTC